MLPHIKSYLADHSSGSEFPFALHSPGRINIIGEHTDYTGGLVMPAAIDKGIEFYARPIEGNALRLHAVDLNEQFTLSLPVGTKKTGELWVDYLAGIVHEFQLLGHEVPALEIVFGGNVPRGSGMSSSAALEGGMAFLLNEVTGAGIGRPQLAVLCRRSSNNYIGVPTGIMDQFASLNGSADGPIKLDCETLHFTPVVADLPGYSWILVNSMVTHELGSSEYPVRVKECAAALAAIRAVNPDVNCLSHATDEQLSAVEAKLSAKERSRAQYVISENQRVEEMARALNEGDATTAGKLLNATHAGLRDDFEVSCAEVDFLQREAVEHFAELVAGSRIMGGGFGGCTINLVKTDSIPALKDHLSLVYAMKYDQQPEFYEVTIGPGTRLI
ncbi:galactokinase [Neolewinella aurantiaca]|uniref:Galactokinase n=1 Tax=Neolewinella aurantiaca TaxID=2602767 RepID=A0A5C7FPH9_9BACT|nr:galactokinase [Neolewinella aurantiaca]TXF87818.1 galactokinase [Neolewinella aurantiaca]